MNEEEMRDYIQENLEEYIEEFDDKIVEIRTFQDAGILTYNKGLVIRTNDGSEFQITIVQSK